MNKSLVVLVVAVFAGPGGVDEESSCVDSKQARLQRELVTLKETLAEQQRQAEVKQQSYLQAAQNRLLLDTPQRQRSEQAMRNAVYTLIQDKTDAARLLDGIYGGIQRRSDTWVNLFGYDPIDKSLKLENPLKALILLKNAAQRLKANTATGVQDADPALKMLQYNLGDEEGMLVYRLDLTAIEKAASGSSLDMLLKKESDK